MTQQDPLSLDFSVSFLFDATGRLRQGHEVGRWQHPFICFGQDNGVVAEAAAGLAGIMAPRLLSALPAPLSPGQSHPAIACDFSRGAVLLGAPRPSFSG